MKIYSKSLSTNAILNIIRQCCNIIFPLVTYPYVSRVLGTDKLGKYSFSNSVIQILMVVAALGISSYAIREGARIRDNREKLCRFASEIFSINIMSMAAAYLILFAMIALIPRLRQDVILMYILCVNIGTSVMARDWINTIYEDFLYISFVYIFFHLTSVVLILLLVKGPEDYIRYTLIMLFANSGAYLTSFFYTQRYIPLKFTFRPNLREHLKPIMLLFSSSLAITIYIRSDITILGFLRPDTEVGIYTLSTNIYSIVKAVLNACIMVAIPRLSNYLGSGKKNEYNALANTIRSALFTLVFPAVVGLFCLSRNVMLLIGGAEYETGYQSLKVLCAALAFAVFGCFYAQGVLVVNRREKYFFEATIISAVINIVLNILIIPYMGMNGAALTTLTAECVVLLMCKRYSQKCVELHMNRDIISVIAGCGVIIVICDVSASLIKNNIWVIVCSILLSGMAYIITLLSLKNSIARKGILMLKRRMKK